MWNIMHGATNYSSEKLGCAALVPCGWGWRHCDRVMMHRRIRCELDPVLYIWPDSWGVDMIHLRSESVLFYCAAVSYLFSLIKIIYCEKKKRKKKLLIIWSTCCHLLILAGQCIFNECVTLYSYLEVEYTHSKFKTMGYLWLKSYKHWQYRN